MMTKKDFNALAKEVSQCQLRDTTFSVMVHHIANVCEKSNPRFDRDRFVRACMTNGEF